jgi:hypothetical protein
MKLKSRILIYLVIPIGLLIKVALFVLLLSLPEGCKNRDDKRLKDIEGKNYVTAINSLTSRI